MNIATKKLNNGFEMPVFGLGTWMMGGAMTKDPRNDQSDIRAIKEAIEAGITHIDTAEKYAEGHAEELVGEAIKEYDRKKLFLVSKVGQTNLRYKDLHAALTASLERLQTDYLDVYMIHGPSQEIPIEESMQALDEAVDRGLIKHIAISNFSVPRIIKAQQAARHPIVAGQYHLNLTIREAERKGILAYHHDHDMIFIAWRPVQKGLLTTQDHAVLNKLCKKYGKTPAQIAINWLISQQHVVTLSKMSDSRHLKENLGALGWQLEPDDVILLTKDFPNQQEVSDAVPLMT